MRSKGRVVQYLSLLITVLACASGCSSDESGVPRIEYSTVAPSVAPGTDTARGHPTRVAPGARAWTARIPTGSKTHRIVYASVSGVTGAATKVSGAVFVPPGSAPKKGWPLVVYAHGTTGVTPDCAPSDRDDMVGDLAAVAGLLRNGYAVVTTDYQGLGVRTGKQPAHPYLEPRTAAANAIDAAKAARAVEPSIGRRWIVVGASQGGAAAWATAEAAATSSLDSGELIGAVALVPVLDLSGYVGRAQSGELTPSQRWLYPILVTGMSQIDSTIKPDALLHGEVARHRAEIASCKGRDVGSSYVNSAPPDDFRPSNSQAATDLRGLLHAIALPRVHTSVPIAAFYGSVDDINPVADMETQLGRACGLGDTLLRVRKEGQGHGLDPGAEMGDWVADRFAGRPAPSNC